jgi:hypothetical protein
MFGVLFLLFFVIVTSHGLQRPLFSNLRVETVFSKKLGYTLVEHWGSNF